MSVRSGAGTRGEDLKGILAVSKDSNVVEAIHGKALKEGLQAKADCIDLPEVVGAGTESCSEVDAQARVAIGEENGHAGTGRPGFGEAEPSV